MVAQGALNPVSKPYDFYPHLHNNIRIDHISAISGWLKTRLPRPTLSGERGSGVVVRTRFDSGHRK